MKEALAVHGAKPVIGQPFKPYDPIDSAALESAIEVLRTRKLSDFMGAAGEGFLGGEQNRRAEQITASIFNARNAVAVNSWTSGLIAAAGAIGLEPGDEVITTPWTMCATATSALHWDAIPVFCDIDSDTFNLDPAKVEQLVTARTRAIFAVDIFGRPCDSSSLRKIADQYGLRLIIDSAQAPLPGAHTEDGNVIADVWGYSFNYHKHLHCGEGGIALTNDDDLAWRLQLIRNHGEAVLESSDREDLRNLIGSNFRLGEVEATLITGQLSRVEELVESRAQAARRLVDGLKGLPGLELTNFPDQHAFYILPMTIRADTIGVDRDRLAAALKAEGVPGLVCGYQNLHRLGIFVNKTARGSQGFPWTQNPTAPDTYGAGACPVAEDLHDRFMGIHMCAAEFNAAETSLVVEAFHRVWDSLDSIES